MGLDPQADRDKVHEIVGVQLQESSFPEAPATGRLLPPARGTRFLEEGSRCCGSG